METISSFFTRIKTPTEQDKFNEYHKLIYDCENTIRRVTEVAKLNKDIKRFMVGGTQWSCDYFPREYTEKLSEQLNIKIECHNHHGFSDVHLIFDEK